jgi:WD40 repeat protein
MSGLYSLGRIGVLLALLLMPLTACDRAPVQTPVSTPPLPEGAERRIGTAESNETTTWGIHVSPDGTQVLWANDGRIWHSKSNEDLHGSNLPEGSIAVDVHWASSRYVVGTMDGWIRTYQLGEESPREVLHMERLSLSCLAFSGSGDWVAVGCRSGMIYLWSVSGPRRIVGQAGHEGEVFALRFPPGGNTVVSVGGDGTGRAAVIKTWDFELHERSVAQVPAFGGGLGGAEDPGMYHEGVIAARVSPDGLHLAIMNRDETVRVWRTDTLAEVKSFDINLIPGKVQFSADGAMLAAGSNELHVWGLSSGRELLRRKAPNKPHALAISPDNRFLLVGERATGAVVFYRIGADD